MKPLCNCARGVGYNRALSDDPGCNSITIVTRGMENLVSPGFHASFVLEPDTLASMGSGTTSPLRLAGCHRPSAAVPGAGGAGRGSPGSQCLQTWRMWRRIAAHRPIWRASSAMRRPR